MRILIVEDNMILSGMIEKWLHKAGYEVLTAIDEPGARSILKKNEISLVLGDVRLPEGDGISLLEWMMRSEYGNTFYCHDGLCLYFGCCPCHQARS